MLGVFPGQPRVHMPIVDVKEAAFSHFQAVKVPEAANNRFLVVNQMMWAPDFNKILVKEFKHMGYKIGEMEISHQMMQVMAKQKEEF